MSGKKAPKRAKKKAAVAAPCPEGGEHVFTPDLEYDPSGETVNCEKCGTTPEEAAAG